MLRRRWVCDRDSCDGLPHVGCQIKHARTAQRPPVGEWRNWYLQGGRGSGKTRTGAETLAAWIGEFVNEPAEGDWAIIAPTFGDARDVCMEGPTGLLKALGSLVDRKRDWNRSHGELWLPNRARVFCDGANDGAYRIQGKNLRAAWCDEVGLWDKWDEAWNVSLAFAVRFEPARVIATGTPKMGNPLVALLRSDPDTVVTHMRTLDNAANLAPGAVAALRKKWEGTRLGRQELDGEFLEEVPGALWTLALIEDARTDGAPQLDRVVVGVDPSGASDEDTGASSIGIIVCGYSQNHDHGYVLADYTVSGGPETWAAQTVRAFDAFGAEMIVAEKNYGGAMVKSTLQTARRGLPVKLVSASVGKRVRAQPCAILYDQRRVHHVGHRLGDLEKQMTTWVPDAGMASPDRMDALVWALTELMIDGGGAVHQYAAYGDDVEPVIRRGDLILRGEHHIDKNPEELWEW